MRNRCATGRGQRGAGRPGHCADALARWPHAAPSSPPVTRCCSTRQPSQSWAQAVTRKPDRALPALPPRMRFSSGRRTAPACANVAIRRPDLLAGSDRRLDMASETISIRFISPSRATRDSMLERRKPGPFLPGILMLLALLALTGGRLPVRGQRRAGRLVRSSPASRWWWSPASPPARAVRGATQPGRVGAGACSAKVSARCENGLRWNNPSTPSAVSQRVRNFEATSSGSTGSTVRDRDRRRHHLASGIDSAEDGLQRRRPRELRPHPVWDPRCARWRPAIPRPARGRAGSAAQPRPRFRSTSRTNSPNASPTPACRCWTRASATSPTRPRDRAGDAAAPAGLNAITSPRARASSPAVGMVRMALAELLKNGGSWTRNGADGQQPAGGAVRRHQYPTDRQHRHALKAPGFGDRGMGRSAKKPIPATGNHSATGHRSRPRITNHESPRLRKKPYPLRINAGFSPRRSARLTTNCAAPTRRSPVARCPAQGRTDSGIRHMKTRRIRHEYLAGATWWWK